MGADWWANTPGNRGCIPYVQLLAHSIRFQITISGASPVWRFRELGRPQATTRSPEEKARFLGAFGEISFSLPNGYHCFRTKVPAGVVERAGPYVQEFLAVIVKPAKTGKKQETKRVSARLATLKALPVYQ